MKIRGTPPETPGRELGFLPPSGNIGGFSSKD